MPERASAEEGPRSAFDATASWPTLPGYEIAGELGRGGMGVVYKAFQPDQKRFVALKLIRSGALAGPQERARLQIEAEAASRLRHANIVQVFEIGECFGEPYLAMEYVEGGSLERLLKRGRMLSHRVAAQLVRDLAGAVQYTHDHEIVHRDLKPANVLLRDAGSFATFDDETRDAGANPQADRESSFVPLIADFGLAKRLDSDSTAWTQVGAVLGTASYMAPEQAAGQAREVGRAADVYALGTILYELLAGRPPFRGDTWHETIEQVIRDDPPRLSRWGVAVPADLETICMKCLEKDPIQRYASAADLASDLERELEGSSILAAPASERERIARRAARDGYTIVGEIGRGPRSTTYHALFGPLRQPVALKAFYAGICDEDAWNSRLESGSRLSAMLSHPQVTLSRQAGWWDGTPFLVTEYAPQGSLAAALAERRFSLRESLRLVAQLAEIVCYLHRQGVTHANLKPSNVLFAADGIPRLCDLRALSGLSFGLPPAEASADEGLAYLAPELLDQPDITFQPCTDVYGLGAILYTALAGRPPFVAARTSNLLEQIRSTTAPSITSFEPGISPQLDSFCERCLRKEPWRRFVRAYDFLTSVRRFLRLAGGGAPQDRNSRR